MYKSSIKFRFYLFGGSACWQEDIVLPGARYWLAIHGLVRIFAKTRVFLTMNFSSNDARIHGNIGIWAIFRAFPGWNMAQVFG